MKSSEGDYPGAASLPSPCFSLYRQNSSAEAEGIRGPALLLVGLLSRAGSPCLSGSNLFPTMTWLDLAGGSPQLHGDLAAAGQPHPARHTGLPEALPKQKTTQNLRNNFCTTEF